MSLKNIAQGGRLQFHSGNNGWCLGSGEGTRSFWTCVLFDRSFIHPPFVALSLTGIDASKECNLRVVVEAHSVTQFGFDLEVRTWADTHIEAVSLNWIAYNVGD